MALAAEYAGWDQPVQDTINSLEETFRWGIYDRAPLPYWSTERITLMGDAAHPMVPHIGQRAGQSIEDGFTLAVLLESCTSDKVADRLRLYKAIRLERTSKVQALARAAGKLYRSEHDDPSEKAARLREWMAQGTWVFAHDAEILSLGHLSLSGRRQDSRKRQASRRYSGDRTRIRTRRRPGLKIGSRTPAFSGCVLFRHVSILFRRPSRRRDANMPRPPSGPRRTVRW